MSRQPLDGIIKNHINIGLLAHVDAGKTTLSEAILYKTGSLRKLGRVDHQDAFLDNYSMERARGITIFSKSVDFMLHDTKVTLLDTPGHVDFSAETERTLQVLDYAVLLISGTDGVQSHTRTLWRLLAEYGIPVFLFVNKMDLAGADRAALLQGLRRDLDGNCVDFAHPDSEEFMEEAAMCEEETLEHYMDTGRVETEEIVSLIRRRKLFPCYFGSALRLQGVDALLGGLERYTKAPEYPREFGARVYKISRDEKGMRQTHLKVTGGSLTVKQAFPGYGKADQIRIYSGKKYELAEEVPAGTVCTVTGLQQTFAGQGFGREEMGTKAVLTPLLTYRMILPEGTDVPRALSMIREVEEEEPALHVIWNSRLEEIHVQLMGEVQTEILKSVLEDRFSLSVAFDAGHIVYKETIQNEVTGTGHYEPLRHYAHVNLILRPGKPGSGLVFSSICREDDLDRNWQRLILTHLAEKEHVGVLTGMPVTDMEIILHSGKAHLKHTEGGDFRQATYRAVRQGLKKAKSVLLEPWYRFLLELPGEQVGRAMSDIQKKCGRFEPPVIEEGRAILRGAAPVSEMLDYQKEVWTYTKGSGRLQVSLQGYEPCHNAEKVIERIGYDSDQDQDNPADSVFCSHGAGYLVPWDEVDEKCGLKVSDPARYEAAHQASLPRSSAAEEAELMAIMEREFGQGSREAERRSRYRKKTANQERKDGGADTGKAPAAAGRRKKPIKKKDYLLVDGYNIIFAWEELRALSEYSMDAARRKLMDILSNYQGYTGCVLILVFDAYKVECNPGQIEKFHNIYVVFTREAETADQYIEKTTHEIAGEHHVTVATSDHLEQVIVTGAGALKISAADFYDEIERVSREIREEKLAKRDHDKIYIFHSLDEKTAEEIEKIRLGEKEFGDL